MQLTANLPNHVGDERSLLQQLQTALQLVTVLGRSLGPLGPVPCSFFGLWVSPLISLGLPPHLGLNTYI